MGYPCSSWTQDSAYWSAPSTGRRGWQVPSCWVLLGTHPSPRSERSRGKTGIFFLTKIFLVPNYSDSEDRVITYRRRLARWPGIDGPEGSRGLRRGSVQRPIDPFSRAPFLRGVWCRGDSVVMVTVPMVLWPVYSFCFFGWNVCTTIQCYLCNYTTAGDEAALLENTRHLPERWSEYWGGALGVELWSE